MVWVKVEAGVAVRMELQGQQDVGVFAWKVNPGLKTGWGFMGCKMFSGLPELSTGWSFKASRVMKW